MEYYAFDIHGLEQVGCQYQIHMISVPALSHTFRLTEPLGLEELQGKRHVIDEEMVLLDFQ